MNSILTFLSSFWLQSFLLPVFVVVVLPVSIVLIIAISRKHSIDKKTELAMKAIEKGETLDPSLFIDPKTPKTPKEKVFAKLTSGTMLTGLGIAFIIAALIFEQNGMGGREGLYLAGSILLFLGIAFLITYFVGKKDFAKEIAEEEKQLGKTE